MTKPQRQLIAFRKQLGMSTKVFAEWCGRKYGRTVRRWESGDMPVPPELERLMAVINKLPDHVSEEMTILVRDMGVRK